MTPEIEAAVAQVLRDSTAVTAVVGTRVHIANRIQSDEYPALCVRKIDPGITQTIDADYGSQTPTIAVEIYALSHFDTTTLANLVKAAVLAGTGTIAVKKANNTTYGTRDIHSVVFDGETDFESPPQDGSDYRGYDRAVSFWILTTGE